MREEDSRSCTLVHVTGPGGGTAICDVPLANPFPAEVRLGCTARVDGAPVRITKRWFRPVLLATDTHVLAIERVGLLGFCLRLVATGAVLAERRHGVLTVDGDLPLELAALAIAAVEVPLTEAVCPVAWLGNI